MIERGEEGVKDTPGVILPPPLIFVGILLLGLVLDRALSGPGFGLDSVWRIAIAVPLILAGFTLIILAARRFRSARTNVQTRRPATTIVTTGLYRYSRNPIYLGMMLAYIGLSLLADSVLALAGLPAAIIVIRCGVIAREERYLEAKFGDAYRAYKRSTRRWI